MVSTITNKKAFAILLLLLVMAKAGLGLAASSPRAYLDRSRISLDETVNLRIELDGTLPPFSVSSGARLRDNGIERTTY